MREIVNTQKDQKKNLISGTKSSGIFCSKPKGKRIAHSKRLLRKTIKDIFSVPDRK